MTAIGTVKDYLKNNITSKAWERIQLRLLPEYKERGLYLHTMTDEKELDNLMMRLINLFRRKKCLYCCE